VAAVEEAVTSKTRVILINTPNNPTGAVASREDLEAIGALARERDLLVVSDECYEKFLYEGSHVSIASLPGMRQRSIVIGAASKTFSMTGWRVGWLILPPEVKPYVAKCHQHLTTCAASFAQAGVTEALKNADGDVARMIEGYRERRDFFVAQLRGVPGLELHMPQGAFYVFPRVSCLTERFGVNEAELAAWLLDEAGVATVPGGVFHSGGDFLRMAYCRPLEELTEAAARMKEALKRIW
jgi:aspartate aminotransferase/aminotransferase